jgi:hypothetical protein
MSKASTHLGHVGNCASFACAIHCIAMPFVISVLPALGMAWLATKKAEIAVLSVAIGFSIMSLCWGYTTHKSFKAFAFIVAGSMWFYMAMDDMRHHLAYSLVGGGCLVAANIWNRRLCKTCHTCCNVMASAK